MLLISSPLIIFVFHKILQPTFEWGDVDDDDVYLWVYTAMFKNMLKGVFSYDMTEFPCKIITDKGINYNF